MPAGIRHPIGTQSRVRLEDFSPDEIVEMIGPEGPQGPEGPEGPPGPGVTYVHDEPVAVNMWDIEHDMGAYPNVATVDEDGYEFISDVQYVDGNRIVVRLNLPVAGKAYLS